MYGFPGKVPIFAKHIRIYNLLKYWKSTKDQMNLGGVSHHSLYGHCGLEAKDIPPSFCSGNNDFTPHSQILGANNVSHYVTKYEDTSTLQQYFSAFFRFPKCVVVAKATAIISLPQRKICTLSKRI